MENTHQGRRLVLALDYGGTKHRVAVAEAGARSWLVEGRAIMPPGADAQADLVIMRGLASRLLGRVGGRLVAVGVSFGGPVDPASGTVRRSHHVPGWEDLPLRERLAAEYGVPVAVANDANAAALGEWSYGAGQGASSLLYVTVSTGIGAGLVWGAEIYGGADGLAGELGHVTARPGGVECTCGRRGCLETEAAGPAIARIMRERMGAGPAFTGSASDVARLARAGDPIAREVIDYAAATFGAGLAGAINLINPERVILGGGVTEAGERWWSVVRATARAQVLPEIRVEIQPAALGGDSPLWGAVALATRNLND
jgi:glucokinase